MKRKRILILYAVICVILSAAAIIALLLNARTSAKTASAKVTVTAFESPATSLTLERGGETLTLTTTGDVWIMNGDSDIPVRNTDVSSMSSAVSHLTASRTIPASEISLSDCGLEPGELTLTASNGAGESAVILLGNLTPAGDARYLLCDDTVYLVNADTCDRLDKTFEDLLAYDEMPDILPSDLVSLTILRDSQRLELFYDEKGFDGAYEQCFNWYIGSPFAEPVEADEKNAHSLFYDVTGLYFYDCAAFRTADLSPYGFDAPLCTAVIVWHDDTGDENTTTVVFGSETDDGYIYVRLDDSDMVLKANASIAHQIAYTAASDLLPRQVCAVSIDTVTELTVEYMGETRTFAGTALSTSDFTDFYTALCSLTSDERAPDSKPDSPYLTVRFRRNTDHDAEMTLCYYPYNEEYYLASFDGRQNQLVSAEMLDAVMELYTELS